MFIFVFLEMKRLTLILALAACNWIKCEDRLIGDGGNIIVFALPGVNPTPVANILLNPTKGVFNKYTKNIKLEFEELNAVLKNPRMDKQICSAIRNRDTNRSVIDAFQFNELTTLKPHMVYDIFNKTFEAVRYRVDVAVFVIKHYEAKASDQLNSFINTVLRLVLRNRVQNAIVVCHQCAKPDFFQFGKPYNHQPLKNINSFIKGLRLSDLIALHVKNPLFKKIFVDKIVASLIQEQLKYLIVNKPVIILLGQMGVGKSTIGNCLINLDASEELILDRPFNTHNNVISCSNQSSIFSGNEFVVIDTVGFGDPLYPVNSTLSLFRNALELVNYRVDLFLFVTESGRLTKETIEFFETISQNLLTENVMPNAIFICNKCKQGWIDEQKRARKYQKEKTANFYSLVDKFGNRTFEFNLELTSLFDFDGVSEDEVTLRNQLAFQSRKRSIDRLASFLKMEISKKKPQDGGEVNMDFVISKNFEYVFLKDLQTLSGNRILSWNGENANPVGFGGLGLVCVCGAGTGVAYALAGTLTALGMGTCVVGVVGFAYLGAVSAKKAVQKYYASDRFSATECITSYVNLSEEPKSWLSSIVG